MTNFVKHRTFVMALGLVAILTAMAMPTAAQNNEAEQQAKLKALSASIEQLKSELNAAKTSKDKLQQSLQHSEEEVSELSGKVSKIKEALAREKKHLARLKGKRTELEQQKSTLAKQIETVVVKAYQLGQQSRLKLLLNQEDPQRMGRLLQYHDYIVQAHRQQITHYLDALRDLDLVEANILASQQTLKNQQQDIKQRQQQLAQSQKKRLSALNTLNRALKEKNQRLNLLSADRKRLQRLLDEMESLANLSLPDGATPFARTKGKLPMPTAGKVLYRFGSPQFDGKLKRNGMVIANRIGAKVVSVHHGRVIFSDYLRGHGLLLIIDHGDGYMSLYGHNQTLKKEIGEWVNGGETIATVGNSGGQQRSGLYFEIRYKGRPQNPQQWLKKS